MLDFKERAAFEQVERHFPTKCRHPKRRPLVSEGSWWESLCAQSCRLPQRLPPAGNSPFPASGRGLGLPLRQ